MTPTLVAIALGAIFTAMAAAWVVRHKLRPGVVAQRRIALEQLSPAALIGPILHQLAQDGWRIDGARSAHAEGFEHVLKRDRQVGLLGLRRGKQANLEPHHFNQLVGIGKTWGADRIWLICTGDFQRGDDSSGDDSLLALTGIDELWGMHAALLSTAAKSQADRAQHRLKAAALGAFVGVLLLTGSLTWVTQSLWSPPESDTQDIALPDEQLFSAPSPIAEEALTDELMNEHSTPDQQAADPVQSGKEPQAGEPTAGASPDVADPPAEAFLGPEPVSPATNQLARRQLAEEVTALPGVRKAGWASVSTLVINLHPGYRVEEVADRTCGMAAASPELGALRLQLLQPPQDDQPPTPRWRLCR